MRRYVGGGAKGKNRAEVSARSRFIRLEPGAEGGKKKRLRETKRKKKLGGTREVAPGPVQVSHAKGRGSMNRRSHKKSRKFFQQRRKESQAADRAVRGLAYGGSSSKNTGSQAEKRYIRQAGGKRLGDERRRGAHVIRPASTAKKETRLREPCPEKTLSNNNLYIKSK